MCFATHVLFLERSEVDWEEEELNEVFASDLLSVFEMLMKNFWYNMNFTYMFLLNVIAYISFFFFKKISNMMDRFIEEN